MTDRKYSIDEINRMRAAISTLNMPDPMQSFYQAELDVKVEQQLRTYMANGTDPEELEMAAGDRLNLVIRGNTAQDIKQ